MDTPAPAPKPPLILTQQQHEQNLKLLREHLRETPANYVFALYRRDIPELTRADWGTRKVDFIASRKEGARMLVFFVDQDDKYARAVTSYTCGIDMAASNIFLLKPILVTPEHARSLTEAMRRY